MPWAALTKLSIKWSPAKSSVKACAAWSSKDSTKPSAFNLDGAATAFWISVTKCEKLPSILWRLEGGPMYEHPHAIYYNIKKKHISRVSSDWTLVKTWGWIKYTIVYTIIYICIALHTYAFDITNLKTGHPNTTTWVTPCRRRKLKTLNLENQSHNSYIHVYWAWIYKAI